MSLVFMSYPDEDPRRGWYLDDDAGQAVGAFRREMGLELFAALEGMHLRSDVRPLIRRMLPDVVVTELREVAGVGLAALVLGEDRLDQLDRR